MLDSAILAWELCLSAEIPSWGGRSRKTRLVYGLKFRVEQISVLGFGRRETPGSS